MLAAALLCGCGKAAPAKSVEATLEREDLVAVSRQLLSLEARVSREVRATKAAWPYIYKGIPRGGLSARARALTAAAERAAEELPLPELLEEREAATLTGPSSPLAGRYRYFQQLCTASWRLFGVYAQQIESGPPAARTFARANVNLYIEGIYDSHYTIAHAGKEIADGYGALGGAEALGKQLPASEVKQLQSAYSEPADRLYPHELVKLGS